MTQTTPTFSRPSGNFETVREHCNPPIHVDRILERLSDLEVPGKEHFEIYLHHKYRVNHKPKTINASFTSIMLFLDFYGKSGKSDLKEIERELLNAGMRLEVLQQLMLSGYRGNQALCPFNG